MFKKIFLRTALEALALFLILCGIDMLLQNDVAVTTNLLIGLLAAGFKNMLSIKRYYQLKLQENEIEMKNLDSEKKS